MKDYTLPFNIFDTLAYLSVGFLFWTMILSSVRISPESFLIPTLLTSTYMKVPVVLLISYITGHIFAHFSSTILEKLLIAKKLGHPSANLLQSVNDNPAQKIPWFFKSYMTPYPAQLATKIVEAYEAASSMKFNHHDAFMFCFHYVKEKSPTTYGRLLTFIQLYDFCRNICIMFFFSAVILLSLTIFSNLNRLAGTIVLLLLSFIFLLRYLKFYRLYGDEVFRSFFNLHLQRGTSKC